MGSTISASVGFATVPLLRSVGFQIRLSVYENNCILSALL